MLHVSQGSGERGLKMAVSFSFYLRISFLLLANSIFASSSLAVAFALSHFPFFSSLLISQHSTKANVLHV